MLIVNCRNGKEELLDVSPITNLNMICHYLLTIVPGGRTEEWNKSMYFIFKTYFNMISGDKADPVPSNLICEHHNSPNNGSFWTNDTITFQLTNPKQNQNILNRFHMYQPIINISKIESSESSRIEKVKSVNFPQLQFIAFIAIPHYYKKEIIVLKSSIDD